MISEVEVLLLYCSLTKMGLQKWVQLYGSTWLVSSIYISVLDILEYRHVSKIKHVFTF